MDYILDLKDNNNILNFLEKDSIIEASAGTGKTYTIIELVKTLILEKDILPENILIVTFTEKATGELKERIFKKFDEISKDKDSKHREKALFCVNNINRFEIHTIHSFCNKLIREYPFEIGCDFENSIIDDSPFIEEYFFDYLRKGIFEDFNDEDIIKRIFSTIGFEDEKSENKVKGVLEYLKKVKFIFPLKKEIPQKEDIENNPENKNLVVDFIASRVYEKVKKFKKENGFITFDDMIHYVYEAVRTNESFVEKLQNQYRYAFIDEFQDTDPVQWEIFKTIFLEGTNNRICIIGDPKQSIYLFRNASVDVFFEARDKITKKGGYIANLKVNYRSTDEFVKGYNKIFKIKDYFRTENITYNKDISTPSDNKKRIEGLKSINFIKLNDKSNLFEIIANEIKRIVNNKDIKIYDDECMQGRTLSFKDIAILVSSRIDANKIEKYLRKCGIPSSFYKKDLLFQSDEAIQIFYLLDYLTDMKNSGKLNKLLLSDFFILDAKDDKEKIVELLSKLCSSSKVENIITNFFKKIELEKKLVLKYKNHYRRILINYRHIAEKIESIAFREKLSLYALKNRLLSLIYSEKEEELSEDLFRNEGEEEDVVKIMTIHISKGLEFPVVFDLGAVKGIPNNKRNYYYSDYKNGVIEHIIEFENKNKDKMYEEYRRLHYVAITRGEYGCYIPVKEPDKKLDKYPSLAKWLGEKIKEIDKNYVSFLEETDSNLENESKKEDEKKIELELCFTNNNYNIDEKRFFTIQSFSSLKKSDYNKIFVQDESLSYKDDEDESILEMVEDNLKSLPGGKKTGTMLHKILERIDYTNFDRVDNIIEDCLKFIKTEGDYKGEIKNLMELLTDKILFDDFNLKKLNEKNRKNEVEFYFNLDDDFVTGAIDLLFNYKGKYYIVDWKSNRLSENESVEDNFKIHYEDQAKIYSYSIKRYLEKVRPDFNYERDFGGVFYIYLRYINRNDNTGIIFKRYGNKEIEDFYNELKGSIKTSKQNIIEKLKKGGEDE